MSEPSPDEGVYTSLFPFVCVVSNGGPLDDHAFVAGMRFADADHALRSKVDTYGQYAHPEMEAQYDLLAMHHGYSMTAVPWDEHPDEHVEYTFTRLAVVSG